MLGRKDAADHVKLGENWFMESSYTIRSWELPERNLERAKRNKLDIKHLYEGNWGIHVMPIERSIDIDSKFELNLINFLIKNEK